MKKKRTLWTIQVSEGLDQALEAGIHKNGHVSKSDFVRDVVRQRLREKGIQC